VRRDFFGRNHDRHQLTDVDRTEIRGQRIVVEHIDHQAVLAARHRQKHVSQQAGVKQSAVQGSMRV